MPRGDLLVLGGLQKTSIRPLTGGDYAITKAMNLLGYAPRTNCLAALVETYRDLLQRAVL